MQLDVNPLIYKLKQKEGSVCWFTGWAVNSMAKAIEGSNPFLPNVKEYILFGKVKSFKLF